MLNLLSDRRYRDCDGNTRREFLKVGALGLGSLTLPGLLAARAKAAAEGKGVKDTSVVLLWLPGGPTHVETFDPKMEAPSEYRSIVGAVDTVLPGVQIGGLFPKMAAKADKMAFVRSFAHSNSDHGGGTHYVLTGYDLNGNANMRPCIGSIVARARGANHPKTGIPTYVRANGGLGFDGPAWLGTAYAPFDPSGDAHRNMSLTVEQPRVGGRKTLLKRLDRINRQVDRTGVAEGLDAFERQAFDLILGRSKEAFDLTREDPRIRECYGPDLGERMLIARRLCEVGSGFVTLSYGGWDHHGQIAQGLQGLCPQVDRAVAAFVEDVHQRGLSEKILLVISGEFGRTPRINGGAGRDHWAPLSTLALAGGGLKMGQVVGESAPKLDVPKSTPIGPQDLMATLFHVLGIDQKTQFTNAAGRPVYMIENGKPIDELV